MLCLLLLTACGSAEQSEIQPSPTPGAEMALPDATPDVGLPEITPGSDDVGIVEILLSDDEIRVDGAPAGTNAESGVYIANDIVYYEEGKDFTYGEGEPGEAHRAEAAAEHIVVHIAQPGTYSICGALSRGQIAVDLGEDAAEDPEAVVTLVLNGMDITCDVAPAVIFYNVYECGSADVENASKDVDTSAAGANVVIADGTTNTVNGSHVAAIYEPDSVVLNEDGTEVEESKRLHKYDGAFYSRMSMNINGESGNTGTLTINADNEGLDSELHLTINGGVIHINSGNDGINTNEDGISVTTINGGEIYIRVTGETGEGDGIDSNGWLVINGGIVVTQACSFSGDAGIDSDMGIHINGGTVIGTGHMLDRIEDGGQNYAVFTFAEKQSGGKSIALKNSAGDIVMDVCPNNDYSIVIYSSAELAEGTYTLWSDGEQLSGQRGGMMGGSGMPGMPGIEPGMEPPADWPEGHEPGGATPPEPPEGMERPEGEPPFGQNQPGGMRPPEGGMQGQMPGNRPAPDMAAGELSQERSVEFEISRGGNMFQGVKSE